MLKSFVESLPAVRINCINDFSKLIPVKVWNNDDDIKIVGNVSQGGADHSGCGGKNKSMANDFTFLKQNFF